MKLKNKRTGEINILKVGEDYFDIYKDDGEFVCPVTLKELNDGWEDYEEPKEYWYVSDNGYICTHMDDGDSWDEHRKEIGNCFSSREEAELAVRKLKAWKRLKDKGFRFDCWDNEDRATIHDFVIYCRIKDLDNINKDLNLLFGGEE